MSSNDVNVLRVGKNVDQFIIGQEIESWEGFSLQSHVVIQRFLDFIKNSVVGNQIIEGLEWVSLHNFQAVRNLLSFDHQSFEELINLLKFLRLIRQ
jgi:hypothetical protein